MTIGKLEKHSAAGEEILSNAALTVSNKRLKRGVYFLAGLVLFGTVSDIATNVRNPLPPVLNKETGQMITTYSAQVDKLTLEERVNYAKLLYIALRQRTGYPEIDVANIEGWKQQVTPEGARSWMALSNRWANLLLVEYDKRMTVEVLSAKPDMKNEYSYVIEAVEREANLKDPRSEKQYRVRFTMYFTDPTEDGATRLSAMALHEEEQIR